MIGVFKPACLQLVVRTLRNKKNGFGGSTLHVFPFCFFCSFHFFSCFPFFSPLPLFSFLLFLLFCFFFLFFFVSLFCFYFLIVFFHVFFCFFSFFFVLLLFLCFSFQFSFSPTFLRFSLALSSALTSSDSGGRIDCVPAHSARALFRAKQTVLVLHNLVDIDEVIQHIPRSRLSLSAWLCKN